MDFIYRILKAKKQDNPINIVIDAFPVNEAKSVSTPIDNNESLQKKQIMDAKLDTILKNAFSLVDPNEILANIEDIKREQREEKAKKAKIIPLFLFPSYTHVVNMAVSVMVFICTHTNFYTSPIVSSEFYDEATEIIAEDKSNQNNKVCVSTNSHPLYIFIVSSEFYDDANEIIADYKSNQNNKERNGILKFKVSPSNTKAFKGAVYEYRLRKKNVYSADKINLLSVTATVTGTRLSIVCNDSYTWWVPNYSILGEYHPLLANYNACDSIIFLKLEQRAAPNPIISDSSILLKFASVKDKQHTERQTELPNPVHVDRSGTYKDTIINKLFGENNRINSGYALTMQPNNWTIVTKKCNEKLVYGTYIMYYYSGHGLTEVNKDLTFGMDSVTTHFLDLKELMDRNDTQSKLCIIDGTSNFNLDDILESDMDNSSQTDVYLASGNTPSKKRNKPNPILIIQSIKGLKDTTDTFRACFVNALAGKADVNLDQVVTMGELCAYLKEKGVSRDNMDACTGFIDIHVPVSYVSKK